MPSRPFNVRRANSSPRGIEISTGLNPCHFDNLPQATFTWFIRDGASLTNGLGIAMQEIYFLE